MFDRVLQGGLVVDGTGAKPYPANVCIQDGKIACISTQPQQGREVLDVSGLVVSPGFIDIHSHSDLSPLVDYVTDSKLAQGVTTELCGNCGESCVPGSPERIEELETYLSSKSTIPLRGAQSAFLSISDYASAIEKKGILTNYGMLVGHSALRLAVMGFADRDPNAEELEQLKQLLARELERGAFGMSLGLIYPPSAFSSKEELTELAKVVARYHGILSVHMRNEGPRVFQAVEEMLDIAKESGVHLEISHLKLLGKGQWGQSQALLERLKKARQDGIQVTCDQYPFQASSNSLTALVPHWAHDGGREKMMQRLAAPDERLRSGILQIMTERGGPETILIAFTQGLHPEYEGKYLHELAKELSLEPVDAVIKILLDCRTAVSQISFCIDEKDMLAIMRQNFISVGSDGHAMSFDPEITKNKPHPRNFSTFPRFLQTVREHKLLSLEQAVYKLTGLPASVLGMKDRGLIREGYAADLTVFDPETVGSAASYLEPRVRPQGIVHVLVNGELALRNGETAAVRGGSALLHR